MKNYFFYVATIGVALYLYLFFATPFEPYRALSDESPTRFSFFMYVLLPDEYFSAWTGPEHIVSLVDRIPILLTTLLFFLSATCWGAALLSIDTISPLRIWKESLTRFEFFLFSTVFGLSVFSIHLFWLGYSGIGISSAIWIVVLGSLIWPLILLKSRMRSAAQPLDSPHHFFSLPPNSSPAAHSLLWKATFFVALPIFGMLLILSGMISSTDYDVLSYHFSGAREIATSGSIGFMPHNVYANMPFGAEMFVVWGMVLLGDVFTGALVGKTIIAGTTILTALGLYAFGCRFFSERTGLIAMLLYMTTPWIQYVSTAGLIDTVVGMYIFFAIYALLQGAGYAAQRSFRFTPSTTYSQTPTSIFLTGFFAGSAAACKYPAMLLAVFPLGVYVAIMAFRNGRREIVTNIFVYSLAVLIACGGWYLKNYRETGNPVYPLCYSIFGDATQTWSAEVDARWTKIHLPHEFGVKRFVDDFGQVGMISAWNSPLIIPLCLLCVCTLKSRGRRLDSAAASGQSTLFLFFAWLLFYFTCWWFLTHRIDRFWIPTIPILVLVAGAGADWSEDRRWKTFLAFFLILSCVYGFFVSGAAAPGKNNRFLASLQLMRRDPNLSTPWAVWFNENPPSGRILLVGEAKAFLYEVPILYNTCFNETPLKEIVESQNPAEEFRKRKIEFVLVDWSEIVRFRSPGNYGYSKFVTPEVFRRLVEEGVLELFCPNEELQQSSTIVYRVI